MDKERAPASGEQAAIRGYFVQYEFSACTLYRLLQDNRFDGISICDHAAGICDDLVAFSGQDVIAHQVKSTIYPSPFRLKTELVQNKLIADIAKSWISLRAEYPDKRICIRYIFSGFPSTTDKKNLDNVGHSASLFSYLSNPELEHTKEELLNSEWAAFIQQLMDASTLSENQFFEMFCQLKFLDQQELTRNRISDLDNYAKRKVRDIKHLLPEVVAQRSTNKFLSESDLIDALGWSRIEGLRALHTFPLHPDVQVNSLVEGDLLDTIQKHPSGYISLIGPPGTGKSTTLQRAIASSPEYGVARYLAFLPDERHGLGRAESIDFLNDITFELDKLGFSRTRFAEEAELREEFLKQLNEAHELFQTENQKTLIIIDGLDHIQREENPQHTFFDVLPPPQTVPEGVLFILGTQFLELDGLAPSIIQQASSKDRRIEMKPLPKAAIFDMIDKASMPDHVDRQALYFACSGHPLVARYYIEKLSESTNVNESECILSEGIGTDIDNIYTIVWEALDPDEDAKRVLSLLARIDNTISPTELASIVSNIAVEKVHKQARFLLAGHKEGNWSIFHNSFRVFIGNQTRQRFGQDDPIIDYEYYRQLAKVAENATEKSGQRWLELRYRSRANDKELVRNLATPELFRTQLSKFRPGKDIYLDLRLAYGAIEDQKDLPTFIQLILTEKEIDYRLEAISQLDLVKTHLILEDKDQAFKVAITCAERNDGTYDLVDELFEQGNIIQSRQLFDAIEPVEYFFGHNREKIHPHDLDQLYEWIERAHRFRATSNILEIVKRLSFDTQFDRDPTDDLKFCLARGILYDNPMRDIEDLCKELVLPNKWKRYLIAHVLNRHNCLGNSEYIKPLLDELISYKDELETSILLLCARISFKYGEHELTSSFIKRVQIGASQKFWDYSYREEIDKSLQRAFMASRLSERLNEDFIFDKLEDDQFQNRVLENVIGLGALLARLETSSDPSTIPVKEELIKTCMFLALTESDDKFQSWSPFTGDVLSWYASIIVRLASLHGNETLNDIETKVERLYVRGSNHISGSWSFRLKFAKEVYFVDGDRSKAIKRVRYLEDLIEAEYTPHQAVELRVDLACALAELGAIDQAKKELSLIHNDTCGYWLAAKKEPQYLFWNEAFERACIAAPNRVSEFASQFAQFVIGLSETEGSDTGHRIIYGLIKNAIRTPGQCAGIISRLIGTGLSSWAEIVAALLHGIALLRNDLANHCFLLFNRLVIPFAGEDAHRTINPIYEILPNNLREAAESDFIECVLLFADSSYKVTMLSKLKDVSTTQNEELLQALDRVEYDFRNIRTKEGSNASSSSIDKRKQEFDKALSLAELIEAGDGISEYKAEHVDYLYAARASKLIQMASLPEIEMFLEKRPILKEDAKFTITTTSRLIDLGASEQANIFYTLAEKAAFEGSWSSWFGGEKIAFQKVRKKREGQASQAEGFHSIVADFSQGRASANMVLPDLVDILDLIVPDADWEAIWCITQEHLSAYREYSITDPVEPILKINSEEVLIGYLFETGFQLCSNVLTDRLRDTLLKIVFQPDGLLLFDNIIEVLLNNPKCKREISGILWKLIEYPSCKDLLIKYSHQLASSDDVIVSNIGRNIQHNFNIDVDVPYQELSKFYELAVLGDDNAKRFELPAGIEPGSDFWLDDPWYWTHFLGHVIKMVSRASGIDIEAIRRRCAHFMSEDGGESSFGPDAEKRLQSTLKSLDLRFPYVRLMPQAALQALGKVIEELVRARHIDMDVFQVIWSDIGGPHFANYEFPLEPRPQEISPVHMPKTDSWRIDADTWLALGSDNTIVPIFKEWFVLAEHTKFSVHNNWQKYTCIRTSLSVDVWEAAPDENLFGIPKIVDLGNLDTIIRKRKNTILCTLDDFMYGDLRNTTITINPEIIDSLEWERSNKNPFDIQSSDGSIMVKTLRWMDGIGYPENSQLEPSGIGHIVLISKSARDVIEEKFGKLEINTRVIQRHESDNGKYERIFFDGIVDER